jgi:hypothetical protein
LPKDLNPKQNAPPTLSYGKGRWGKGLRTIINENIVTKKLTKRYSTHLFYLRRWVG